MGERQGWRPLGWAELKDIVRDGSEAALARLGRAPDVQARYVEHLGWVHATYDSVESFILERLGRPGWFDGLTARPDRGDSGLRWS